jgi:hypothetical protein
MDKQLFDQAIGEVPPSTVDVDAVIARGRRAAWVHRAANPWMATAAGVVVVSLGAAVLLSDNSGGGALVGAQSTSSATAAAPPTALPRCGPMSARPTPPTTTVPPNPAVSRGTTVPPRTTTPPKTPDPAETAATTARLSAALRPAVQAHLATGTELEPSKAAEIDGTKYGPLQPYRIYRARPAPAGENCMPDEDYYMARANLKQGTMIGNILIVIQWNAGLSKECDPSGGSAEQASCEPSTTADGSTVVARTLRLEGGAVIDRVEVTRADGTGIILQAENVADDAKFDGPKLGPVPPLRHQQLIEIATTPGLTLAP